MHVEKLFQSIHHFGNQLFFYIFIVPLILQGTVSGHGKMIEPSMRGAMWRKPIEYPAMSQFINYDDMSLNGGGVSAVKASGHGVCGDPAKLKQPRPHETNGTYGKYPQLKGQAIARCYKPGAELSIEIKIKAHHKGYFQFQLCKLKSGEIETEDCFKNGILLQQTNNQGDKYQLPDNGNVVYKDIKYRVPSNIICDGNDHCVLRWYWMTDNYTGEEFWNCADIQISKSC